jgi:HK97 family phage prohead protease
MERKTLLLEKAAIDAETGEFSGYANVFNIVDRGGDRVLPGAFAKDLDRFLAEGFIGWGHDWGQMVAMPVEAKEDTTGLFLRAKFHSTEAAQEKRVITAERLAAGLSMGLSIGYDINDSETVNEDGQRIRNLKELVVYETSLVAVPMNQLSNVTAVKGGGLGSDLPYAEHLDWVLDEVRALVTRSADRAQSRAKEGRVLSSANRDRLVRLSGVMREVMDDLDALMTETEPERVRLAREWDALRAEAIGLGVTV